MLGALCVAPHAGAWIETPCSSHKSLMVSVAPHAGAWIETEQAIEELYGDTCRTPCGCVD